MKDDKQTPTTALGDTESKTASDGIRRRKFLEGTAILSAGAVAGSTVAGSADKSASGSTSAQYSAYPPYKTAVANDAAYARYVSASQVDTMKSLPFLNLHYGERENARVQDAYSGRWYWDCHRNGSKFNLGHRNPQVLAAMREATARIDAGSFAALSGYRAKLAEKLVATTGGKLSGVTFGVGGADAIEIAVHAARNHTNRRGLVSISQVSYHGGTDLGLSLSGISAHQRERYQVGTAHTTFVPFNDLKAMEAAITEDTAAVVMEPSPAQAGFPMTADGYLAGVKAACEAKGAVLILDEIQTGLGGTGTVWAYEQLGVVPDVLCTGKGLGGGLYPISAALMSAPVWHSYTDGQFIPHESTYAGTEIGCVVASAVLDITTAPVFLTHIRSLSERFKSGFATLPLEVTQFGLCMGLRTPEPTKVVAKLVAEGVFAAPSFDDEVVPFRPILTLTDDEADEIILKVQEALA